MFVMFCNPVFLVKFQSNGVFTIFDALSKKEVFCLSEVAGKFKVQSEILLAGIVTTLYSTMGAKTT